MFRPVREPPQKSFRLPEIRSAASNVVKAFGLIWQAHPPSTLGMAGVTLLRAGLPAAQAWAGKLIVDGVVEAIGRVPSADFWTALQPVLPFLVLEFILVTASAVLNQMRSLFEHVLHAHLSHTINTAIIRKSLTLDLYFFENAEYYDKLENARREADHRALSILNDGFSLVQNAITLASFVALLLAFSPLLALLLLGATLPLFIAQTRFSELRFRLLTWRAPEARRMMYLERLLTDSESAKEVKLFGLGEPLLRRYHDLFWKFYTEDTALAKRRSAISVGFGVLTSLSYYAAYAWIVFRTVTGAITLGSMTLYLTVFRQSQSTFQGMLQSMNALYESALFMSNLYGFLSLQPQMKASNAPLKVPRPIVRGIEFRNVSFKYPGRSEWALRNVSVTIAPGEKLALVGANGAGKTTFIKLLTRLYDPTEGQILLDGVDLREYDIDDLRLRIGVIFQDFVRYMMTAGENIGFGQIEALDDRPRIERAAQKGGADEVIATLPQGYDTMLGAWFERGRELSGGQWQKIALGRAFMRDAEVLVLDEPTSALDAEREYEIFQRFRRLTEGRIAILISHRFSTVRMADRIAVLENGELIELGTHRELLEKDGVYARLFNMQAEGYR
ncbi:MAG: ABC transporter ATP-binding protein [Anaerolineae bacterium]|nr:ABC transporter ATP-binding protein/permease [Candidatus Roseilinea sp.]MDW8450634.1 ABC transporter ATP-binding protein [Anaerolineae bacterium]